MHANSSKRLQGIKRPFWSSKSGHFSSQSSSFLISLAQSAMGPRQVVCKLNHKASKVWELLVQRTIWTSSFLGYCNYQFFRVAGHDKCFWSFLPGFSKLQCDLDIHVHLPVCGQSHQAGNKECLYSFSYTKLFQRQTYWSKLKQYELKSYL